MMKHLICDPILVSTVIVVSTIIHGIITYSFINNIFKYYYKLLNTINTAYLFYL